MSDEKKKTAPTGGETQMPLDLKGSEQHHDLKNQPGEKGDPDHADAKGEAGDTVKSALKGKDEKTAMSAALKDAAG